MCPLSGCLLTGEQEKALALIADSFYTLEQCPSHPAVSLSDEEDEDEDGEKERKNKAKQRQRQIQELTASTGKEHKSKEGKRRNGT